MVCLCILEVLIRIDKIKSNLKEMIGEVIKITPLVIFDFEECKKN